MHNSKDQKISKANYFVITSFKKRLKYTALVAKCHLISKCPVGVYHLKQKTTNFFKGFLP